MVNRSQVMESVDFISSKTSFRPDVGLILGSGLGFLADEVEDRTSIDYSEIPHFPRTSVEGHEGRLVFGRLFGKNVVVMKGRVHTYEGVEASKVAYPVYVMKELGVRRLVITNSSGGINRDFKPGDVVAIKDVINFSFRNPLRGPNDESLGPRFPDMSEPLDREWMERLRERLRSMGKDLKEGTYIWVLGPSYETPAEIRAFAMMGADMVGMSTVPEIIAANHLGLRVLGLSCITNMAAGILEKPLNHAEVLKVANMVKPKFASIVRMALEVID